MVLQAANELEDYPDTLANASGMFALATILSRADRLAGRGLGRGPEPSATSAD